MGPHSVTGGTRVAESPGLGRPRVVGAAVVLLMALPLLGLIGAALSLIALDIAAGTVAKLTQDLASRGIRNPQAVVNNGITVMRAETVAQIVVRTLQALGLGVLVVFVLRGSPAARIWAFVIAGLVTIGSLGVPAMFAIRNARLAELARSSKTTWITEHDLLPSWFLIFTYASLVISVAMAAALVWLLTRPTAITYFSRNEPSPEPPPPLGRRLARRWGLIATTALAVLLIIVAATQEWMWVVHIAPPIHSERPYYASDLSVTALAFIAGAGLLVLLVASGIVSYGRTATVFTLCALGAAAVLALDLLLVASVIDELRAAAAELAIGMQRQPGVRWIGFFVDSPGLEAGTPALLLLVVTAAQIPRPDLGPRIQAAAGTALMLSALVLPWATVYSAGLPRETSYRLWLTGGGMILGVGALLLILAAVPLFKRQTSTFPLAQLAATLTLAVAVVIGTFLVDTSAAIEDQLTREPLDVHEGMPPFYLDFGILLVCIGASRTWWRARERPAPRNTPPA